MTHQPDTSTPGLRTLGVLAAALCVGLTTFGLHQVASHVAPPLQLRVREQYELGAVCQDMSLGVDRTGAHLAVTALSGVVHVLSWRGDTVQRQELRPPWTADGWEDLAAGWRDGKEDGRVELMVMGRRRLAQAGQPCRENTPEPHTTYAWRGARLVATATTAANDDAHLARRRWPTGLFDGAQTCALDPLDVGRDRTTVVTQHGRQIVRGNAWAVGDLTGEGAQDLLTAQLEVQTGGVGYRLYQPVHGALRLVWQRVLADQAVGRGRPRSVHPTVDLEDLDGDGRAELILLDTTAGRLTIYCAEAPAGG